MSNDLVDELLRKAGWSPGRSRDFSLVHGILESRGYKVSGQVELFLREFTGIVIQFIRNGRPDSIWFDAERASHSADPEWVEEYERRVGASLVPVGYSNHEHMLLLQSVDGAFYGAFDDYLYLVGSDVREAIVNLVNQQLGPVALCVVSLVPLAYAGYGTEFLPSWAMHGSASADWSI
jgi:hypothetical protein